MSRKIKTIRKFKERSGNFAKFSGKLKFLALWNFRNQGKVMEF